MPVVKKTAIVPYTQAQMYALVNDIESYPQFVPWCVSSAILSQSEDEVRAQLCFARGGMEKSFTTLNRLQPHKMIEIRLVDGPFQQLEGFWTFDMLGDEESKVSLNLEFEFSSRLVAMMFGPLFNQIASMLVDAFTTRAAEVYD